MRVVFLQKRSKTRSLTALSTILSFFRKSLLYIIIKTIYFKNIQASIIAVLLTRKV